MTINQEEVASIANLARIEFSLSEDQRLSEELSAVVDYVETLNQVPTESSENVGQISGLENVTRQDIQKESLSVEKVLQNAPDKKDNFIKTKQVFE